MIVVILRSALVGIAFAVGAIFLAMFIGVPVSIYLLQRNTPPPPPGVEVGYDLVTMAHNLGINQVVILAVIFLVFATGFLVGFHYFSRTVSAR